MDMMDVSRQITGSLTKISKKTGVGWMSQCFTSPFCWGYFISKRYGCFGDVEKSPERDINPNP